MLAAVPPTIGITLRIDDRGRLRGGRETAHLATDYADAVAAVGGVPIHLPVQPHASVLLDRIDGLLIPGGGDFAPPAAYPTPVDFDLVAPRQLEFDRALLAAAARRGLPVLGVCYGMQLLALEGGGSLHYHLPLDLPAAGPHAPPDEAARHPVEFEKETRLAGIFGAGPRSVNTRHHQAVASVGPGQRVAARAADGVIEAIEEVGARFCVGVQWHPERMEAPHRDALFAAFFTACNEARSGR
jgi:putative glutamine amidotransferase